MKILPANNGIVIRIEYYNPYPPDIGYFTFNGMGTTAEEVISELCKVKRIPLPYIRDKCIICSIDTITIGLTDYLINTYHEDYHERERQQKQSIEDFSWPIHARRSLNVSSALQDQIKPISYGPNLQFD